MKQVRKSMETEEDIDEMGRKKEADKKKKVTRKDGRTEMAAVILVCPLTCVDARVPGASGRIWSSSPEGEVFTEGVMGEGESLCRSCGGVLERKALQEEKRKIPVVKMRTWEVRSL